MAARKAPPKRPSRTTTFVALLRGINVTGHNKIAMPALCALCEDIGWIDVRSYIQSGNLVFGAPERAKGAAAIAKLESMLEREIEGRFGLHIPVLVRRGSDWPSYLRSNPFLKECEREPNLVLLALSKSAPRPGAEDALQERAAGGERIARSGDAIWVHYASGVGTSKLTPAIFDRLVGSPVTARNWRTVMKIGELAASGPPSQPPKNPL